ncbi:type IV toxin-antitoxin system AbiEi family antitoxin domain-containing protein [Kribbella sp. NPDC051936]|uniref:type IV toxin-antitoxin system AbiEi family antitoxin domain-containing protein n=1 Tax=Kribbella sp. NPDC051936 TaxID=3154946 RepID=UPI0034252A1E
MNPRLRRLVTARGGWFSRANALDAGYSAGELRLRVRRGHWLRLSRDVYVDPLDWPADEAPWERAQRMHVLTARAVAGRMALTRWSVTSRPQYFTGSRPGDWT